MSAPADSAPAAPLDDDIAAMERRWKDSGLPGLYVGSGPEMRERARCIRALLYPKPKLPAGAIEDLGLPRADGGTLPCRIVRPHTPPPGGPTGTLVYFHGGGWVLGDLDSHEAHCIRLANRAGVVVLSVGYRLAPEERFPAAFDDAVAAVRWAAARLERLGGAGRPLAVGGDSAGGNLAAGMAIVCRDEALPLAAQLLIYPATDLGGEREDVVRSLYLGDDAARKALDWRVSPRRAATLAGLAPAILGVGPHDFLYRDNLAYAQALREAGVPLRFREYAGLNHGFFSYTAISPRSAAAADQLCDDLRELLVPG